MAKTLHDRGGVHPADIMTLSGDELRHMDMPASSDYLLIDLSNVRNRRSGFDEMMKVAMSAAVNAVLATLMQSHIAVKSSGKKSEPTQPEVTADLHRQERTKRNAQRVEQVNARILAESRWLTARELSEKASLQSVNPSAGPNRW